MCVGESVAVHRYFQLNAQSAWPLVAFWGKIGELRVSYR